jgi:DNA-binding MarR family transcriptional regulator
MTKRAQQTVSVDEYLCLALYRASRAMTAAYRPILAELNLTYPQYLVMALLWEEGRLSVGQIGSRLRLESSTLSPLLKRLETMGLISRMRSATDERSVDIELTGHGSGLRTSARDVPQRICQSTGLDLPELATMVSELRALADRVESDTLERSAD